MSIATSAGLELRRPLRRSRPTCWSEASRRPRRWVALVTTSRFGPESYRIARDKPLDLIDGEQLREWLREYLGVDACWRVRT